MGIQIAEIFPKKPIELESLSGRKIAIDAFNWIYAFLTTIKDRDTFQPLRNSKGQITSHLSGLFYRTAKLLEAGIKPVYVFDGTPPKFKEHTSQKRREIREQAKERFKKAIEEGNKEEARIASQQAVSLTGEMIEQCKQLLELMGIPFVQAPSEGEAQCAFLCKEGLIYSVASQDADVLAFGSPRVIRNLNITGRRKIPSKNLWVEIKPELIEAKEVFSSLGITYEQLIILGMLVGTDFNPGIKGIGPKTAIKIVKEEKTLEKIIKKAEEKNAWEGPEPKEVMEFFMNPPVSRIEEKDIEKKQMQPEKLLKFMVDEFEFSEDRMKKAVEKLAEKKEKQAGLGKWIK